MTDFSEYFSLLDDTPFEETPVDLDTFIGPGYLGGKFVLSEIQRDLVESMSQIYTMEDCIRILGQEAGVQHYQKYTKKEVILQLGKGSSRGTDEIFLPETGKWVAIQDLQSSPNNYVLGSSNGFVQNQYATESFIEGSDMVWEIELERGLTMGVTMDHSFYNKNMERVKLSDLKIGDRVAVSTKTFVTNPVRLPDNEAKLLGYWIGDGCMPKDQTGFRMLNMDFGDKDAESMQEYLGIMHDICDDPKVTHHPNGKLMSCVRSHSLDQALKIADRHSLWGKRAHNKTIPDAIWNAPDDQVAEFISRLWGCDGTIYMKKSGSTIHGALEYCTVSKELAIGLQRLLTRFGVLASLRSRYPKYTYNGEKKTGQLTYYLTVADKTGVERFHKHIALLDKQDTLDKAVASYAGRSSSTNYQGDMFFARLKSVKEVGPMPVFTMTATQTSNFIQNLVLNGNSGK